MSIHEFSLDNLAELDYGVANAAMQTHLRRVAQDMLDRPINKQPRTITMTVTLVPAPNDDGTVDRCKCQIRFESKVPKHQTQVYDFALRANGQIAFSGDFAERFDQQSLLGDDDSAA